MSIQTFRAHVDDIWIPVRSGDPVQQKKVTALAESIATIGLRVPISVRRNPNKAGDKVFELITGRHRLAATKRNGETHIEARKEEGSELDAELWEVSENLHRTNMNAKAEADATQRWRELRKRHAEEGKGVSVQNGPKRKAKKDKLGRRNEGRPVKPGSLDDTAKSLGIGKAEAVRREKIAKTDKDAAAILDAAGITAQVDWLAVAEEPKGKQVATAKQLVADKKAAEERKLAGVKAPKVNPIAKAWDAASDARRENFVKSHAKQLRDLLDAVEFG